MFMLDRWQSEKEKTWITFSEWINTTGATSGAFFYLRLPMTSLKFSNFLKHVCVDNHTVHYFEYDNTKYYTYVDVRLF